MTLPEMNKLVKLKRLAIFWCRSKIHFFPIQVAYIQLLPPCCHGIFVILARDSSTGFRPLKYADTQWVGLAPLPQQCYSSSISLSTNSIPPIGPLQPCSFHSVPTSALDAVVRMPSLRGMLSLENLESVEQPTTRDYMPKFYYSHRV